MYPALLLGTWVSCLCVEGSCKEAEKESREGLPGGSRKVEQCWVAHVGGGGLGPDDRWKMRRIPRKRCVCPCSCVEDSETEERKMSTWQFVADGTAASAGVPQLRGQWQVSHLGNLMLNAKKHRKTIQHRCKWEKMERVDRGLEGG
ncbi:hypothetical protein CesoFtcFv8_024826 [Champsocephalus esox]|uniref:Secreted protein n=1 Tax=Champsocephalus esox TaxID=159716 RepID=A0AAN8B349_9TELE|nr:hypothetical protein CesoFtcFv8_024826 [Champsocephalus esox]